MLKKKLLKKYYVIWIHHLCTVHSSKCVHIPHSIIDNYRGNVNNFVYTLSRFIQTILTCQFQQLRSPTKETKQKDMHSKQEQSPECGCMKFSGWKCFYWVEEAKEEFFLFSCWFPPLMIPLLNHSWMLSTQYKWVIAKTSIKMLQ